MSDVAGAGRPAWRTVLWTGVLSGVLALAGAASAATTAAGDGGSAAKQAEPRVCVNGDCGAAPVRFSQRQFFDDGPRGGGFGRGNPPGWGDSGRGRDPGRGGSGDRPGQFDFYVLALSWSPTFCESDAGRRSPNQCRRGAGYGFVVHGLWPQYRRGYPSFCDDRNPPRMAMERAVGVFPEEGLARHQWRKHGSCSGLAPSAYFEATRKARAMVTIPPMLSNIGRELREDPRRIERAFVDANKGLRPDMMAVTCNRGLFREVRICISKDLRSFVSCPEVDRRACRASSVVVPPPM